MTEQPALVTFEALCDDIRRAEPGSLLFYELIREARAFAAAEHARQRELIWKDNQWTSRNS